MDAKIFQKLKPGDIIKHFDDNRAFVVTGNYGGRVTAVSSVDLTNPSEWEVIHTAMTTQKYLMSGEEF